MLTFWNLNREFESQIDLVANKWFANFDSKRRQNAYLVNLESFLNWTRNAYLSESWRLKLIWQEGNDLLTLTQKRRQNGYLVDLESIFSCHPKCKEKATVLELELRTFGSICSCCVHAESFSSFDAKCNMNCFLCNIRTITFAKLYIALCKLTGQIFSGFLHRLIKR